MSRPARIAGRFPLLTWRRDLLVSILTEIMREPAGVMSRGASDRARDARGWGGLAPPRLPVRHRTLAALDARAHPRPGLRGTVPRELHSTRLGGLPAPRAEPRQWLDHRVGRAPRNRSGFPERTAPR